MVVIINTSTQNASPESLFFPLFPLHLNFSFTNIGFPHWYLLTSVFSAHHGLSSGSHYVHWSSWELLGHCRPPGASNTAGTPCLGRILSPLGHHIFLITSQFLSAWGFYFLHLPLKCGIWQIEVWSLSTSSYFQGFNDPLYIDDLRLWIMIPRSLAHAFFQTSHRLGLPREDKLPTSSRSAPWIHPRFQGFVSIVAQTRVPGLAISLPMYQHLPILSTDIFFLNLLYIAWSSHTSPFGISLKHNHFSFGMLLWS